MDFAIPDPAAVGPANPALRTARGPDPLIDIPPMPHLLRRVNGLTFIVAAPGGLAPIANALPSSLVAAMLGHALAIVDGAPGSARDDLAFASGVLPTKYEAVIARLHAEPNIALAANAVYSSPEHLAFCVARLVAALQPGAVDPAYILTNADIYPFEPPAAALAGWVAALLNAGTGLTFGCLATSPAGFMEDYNFLEFVFFGRVLSAARDAPASPFRRSLDQLVISTRAVDMLGTATNLTAATIVDWFVRTMPPDQLQMLRERGVGIDRREQVLRSRQQYTFGTTEQQLYVVIEWVINEPLSSRLANLTAVLRARPSVAVARGALVRLVRVTTRSPSATITDVGAAQQLDYALRNVVTGLAAPGFAVSTVDERVTEVERVLGLTMSHGGGAASAGVAAGASAQGAHSSTASAKAALYSDEVAAILGCGTCWKAFFRRRWRDPSQMLCDFMT